MNNEPLTTNQLPLGLCIGPGRRYRVDSYLANGGFGKTYVGTDLRSARRIAIKELFIKGLCGRLQNGTEVSISLSENHKNFLDHQRKFRTEAQRIMQFSNPHIVRVYDLFDDNGTSYYVMDYIEGRSLAQLLNERGCPLPVNVATDIFMQLLDALEALHNGTQADGYGAPLLHLDIKPGNILVDNKNNVVIIDFGASKQLHDADGNSISTSDISAYTEGYAPIELAVDRNLHYLGPWTDIYSLGATLYRMLTYKHLPSPSEMINGGEHVLSFPPEVDSHLRSLILWMMKAGIADRPQSIAQIRQFLAASNGDEIMGVAEADNGQTMPAAGNRSQNIGNGRQNIGNGQQNIGNGQQMGVLQPLSGGVAWQGGRQPMPNGGSVAGANGPSPFPGGFPAPRRKSHTGLYVLIFIVFLLLAAGGGVAYYMYNHNAKPHNGIVDDEDDDEVDENDDVNVDEDETDETVLRYDQLDYYESDGDLYANWNDEPYDELAFGYGNDNVCAVFDKGKLIRICAFHDNDEVAFLMSEEGEFYFDEYQNQIDEEDFISQYPVLARQKDNFIEEFHDYVQSLD